MKSIKSELLKKILVLDGSYGTYIRKFNLKKYDYHKSRFLSHSKNLFGFHEILNLTNPKLIQEIHEKYLRAGADIIETNSFRANEYYLAKYDLSGLAYEINLTAAKIAREQANKYSMLNRSKLRYVFGSIGPVHEILTSEQYKQVYSQQIKGLLAGRVDGILFETFVDSDNLYYALLTLNEILEKRSKSIFVILSATVKNPNNSLFLNKDFIKRVSEEFKNLDIIAVGENCGFGPKNVYTHIKELSKEVNLPIIVYPSLGLSGKETMSISEYLVYLKKFLDDELVNIIGGCCGTTPKTIEHISKLVKDYKPRAFYF